MRCLGHQEGDLIHGPDLGVEHAATDEAYAAMDWLAARQDAIERGLDGAVRPVQRVAGGLALPAGARGWSRDGKKGKVQIEYGLLTDPEGRPVAVRVLEGNTADPTAFTEILGVVHEDFQLRNMVIAGDRGMITTARIEAHKELDPKYGWITALRAPAIRKLMAGDGPLQLSLSDEQDLAEITSPDFPGERLVACRNPVLAEERARKREALLAATEKLLAPIAARVAAGRLSGAAAIGPRSGRSSAPARWPSTSRSPSPRTASPSRGRPDPRRSPARRDLRHPHPRPAGDLDAAGVVTAYKNLKYVERDFRHIKSDDLDLRPVFHRLEKRVKGHVLICMLAAYLLWHLRQAWAPLTYTDEEPPVPASPVAPARRSASAHAKASGSATRTAAPTSASPGCSPTWAPSPATSPPANSARPSSSSGPPSRTPYARSQDTPPRSPRKRRPAAVSVSKPPVTSA